MSPVRDARALGVALRRYVDPLCPIGTERPELARRERTRTTRETLARIHAHESALGITRIAEITHLDEIGLPTYVACVPERWSESWACGKGFTHEAALTSALMEAYEYRCFTTRSRRVVPGLTIPQAQRRAPILHPSASGDPRAEDRYPKSARFDWMPCVELQSARAFLAPADLVGAQGPSDDGITIVNPYRTTSGMASGNCALEAIQSGLQEVIERDALMLAYFGPGKKVAIRATSLPPRLRRLIQRIEHAGIAWHAFDLTTDIGVPVFEVVLVQEAGNGDYHLHRGLGCHLDAASALVRAFLEACQVRLAFFAGARKDVHTGTKAEAQQRPVDAYLASTETVPLRLPRTKPEGVASIVRRLLRALADAGFAQAFMADLSLPGIELAMVATYVPGLEGLTFDATGERYYPGARAQRAMKAHGWAAPSATA